MSIFLGELGYCLACLVKLKPIHLKIYSTWGRFCTKKLQSCYAYLYTWIQIAPTLNLVKRIILFKAELDPRHVLIWETQPDSRITWPKSATFGRVKNSPSQAILPPLKKELKFCCILHLSVYVLNVYVIIFLFFIFKTIYI